MSETLNLSNPDTFFTSLSPDIQEIVEKLRNEGFSGPFPSTRKRAEALMQQSPTPDFYITAYIYSPIERGLAPSTPSIEYETYLEGPRCVQKHKFYGFEDEMSLEEEVEYVLVKSREIVELLR